MDKNRMGFLEWLQLILITLKLCGVITWTWGLVLWPIWVEIIIGIGLVLFERHQERRHDG